MDVTQVKETSVPYNWREEDSRKGRIAKSGRELTAKNKVVKEVPWPHLRVWKAPNLKGVPYDSFTVTDFTFGHLEQINMEPDMEIRLLMHEHLRELLEDHKDLPDDWDVIRAFHALVLTQMERGLLTWRDTVAIDKLKTKYVYSMRGGN